MDNKIETHIHATAAVSPKAQIEEGAVIGPYVVIGDNSTIASGAKIGAHSVIGHDVKIGTGTVVESHAVIDAWTTVGKDCRIFQFASVGADPQDLKFKGEISYTIIGDRTTIREYSSIHRATGEGEETRVGSDSLLMACTHVAHNCVIGNNVIMSNAAMIAGHAIVEDRAVLGGMCGVHQFVKVGRNAMIGGMSKIVQDCVPYTIVDGHPARVVGLNSVGISRAGIPAEARRKIKQAYKILFRSGLSLAQAIAVIEQEVESSDEVEHFLRFLRNADRGICRERREHE
ncbi:acyl-ACP--UDP-N-acetylglucosamine O-acyltransferase [Selenomonas sp. TAMA-11512]|uniref:acyl-ACP--UDP-N-acetylglucosamine O-acyltransferase n=1 Tax=Selenomonas sp. TAMA-11512 TaxID=3095337 RepID=UPI00308855BB|nr:acyl-ACP--UDP-N-acetylglucosamine O-acyltransferase [Selenomonas sp. TAMA-11512]